jgi:MoxR-like ATPase
VIDDGLVSTQHARITWDKGQWALADLQSSNGTLVNGNAIDTVVLKEGDLIQIGDAQLLFGISDGAAAEAVRREGGRDMELVQAMRLRTVAIRNEVAKVIVGQQEVLDQIMMVLIAGGHGLLIGMPGMAKTLMVRTIAQVLDLQFKRIQFTPDLMPTDITGTEVLETNRDTQTKEFRFVRGPIFCNLLLADEINRTPPKTQAALLEAMQEKRVTVGNVTYTLDDPFFVLATQNPIEQEGTYPLPEAQLDRFMFNIWVDYPQEHEEETIISTTTVGAMVQPSKVLTQVEVLQLQDVVRKIPVSPHVIKYATRLVRATRPNPTQGLDFVNQYVSTGAGPRAGQYLTLAAKARAVLDGRIHVSCQDIRKAALPVLRHRILMNFAADSEGVTPSNLVQRLLDAIPEPSEKDYQA